MKHIVVLLSLCMAAFGEPQGLPYQDNPQARYLSRMAHFNLYLEQANAYLRMQVYAEASRRYQLALDLNPQSRQAREGLRAARYAMAYQNGSRALSRGDLQAARYHFQECLEIRPADSEARRKLLEVDVALARTDALRSAWDQVISSLTAGDRHALDRKVQMLSEGVREAARVGIRTSDVMPQTALFPALLSYAHGNLAEAGQLAADPNLKLDRPLAQQLLQFIAIRRRWEYARRSAIWLAAIYGLVLCLSLYFGLREVQRATDRTSV